MTEQKHLIRDVGELSEINYATELFGKSCFEAGVRVGLQTAEKILGWLSSNSPIPHRELHAWAEKAIQESKRTHLKERT